MGTDPSHAFSKSAQRFLPLFCGIAAAILLGLSLDLVRRDLDTPLSFVFCLLAGLCLTVILLSQLSNSVLHRLNQMLDRLGSWFGISLIGIWLLLMGLLCTSAGSLTAGSGSQVLHRFSLPLWLLGVLLVSLSLRSAGVQTKSPMVASWEITILILIVIAGAILRSIDLASMPYVLSGDEGSVGLVGWEFLEGSRDNLLGLGWFSFPALYSWMLALSQSIFGRSVIAIRLVSAMTGTLTIAATFLAGKILFNRKVGLIAAAWLTTFHYHVFFSRIAYNNIFDGFFLLLAVAFLFRGWEGNQRKDFLLLGITLGLSQYFYTTAHALPLILVLWTPWLHFQQASIQSRRTHLLAGLIVAGSISLPLMLQYANDPSSLTFTASRVSLLDPGLLGPAAAALGTTPFGLVVEQTLVTGLGLTVSELQGIYSGTSHPMLSGVSAIVFYCGTLFGLLRWRSSRYAILLITLLGSLLIGGISIQAPSSQRLILLPPILALLIAAVLFGVCRWLQERWPRWRALSIIVLLGILAWMMLENVHQLFYEYFPNETYGSLNGEVTQEMIEFLQDQSADVSITFIGGERMQFDSIPSMAYLLPGYSAKSIATTHELPAPGTIDQRTIFIVLPEQRSALSQLAAIYPEASTIARYNRHGRLLFYARIVAAPD